MDCLTLKKSNCKNCYKCIRYCPVKSIRFSGNQAYIIGNECILCGQCFVVCPQDAKQIVDETEKCKYFLKTGVPIIASLAPSFIANYPKAGINGMRKALKQLGFYDAEETALGATVIKKEYDRLVTEVEQDVVISTSCHSINLLVQKHFPLCIPHLANILSPMQAHCRDIKKRYPNAKTVFIGPCVAKKDEASHYAGLVDAVLTFDELSQWLQEEGIEIPTEMDSDEYSKARFFPTTGGILKTMEKDNPKYSYIAVDGVANAMAVLRDIERGRIHNCFIEMSACIGSCIGGPVMEKSSHAPIMDYIEIAEAAGGKDFEVEQPDGLELQKTFVAIEQRLKTPSEGEIKDILAQMGKHSKEDELNCASCGYDTCRDKAIAVIHGKAELSMCLPYLRNKAESFSDNIIKNTPNGVIVLNEKLEVQQINHAALEIMNIRRASDVLGGQVVRIMDPTNFLKVLGSGRNVKNKKVYLAEYEKYVEMTISYDKEYRLLIGMMRDITDEEQMRERKEEISRQTVEIADRVVNKQMRIVQEIASLLGETAAETKSALSKLKESIDDE